MPRLLNLPYIVVVLLYTMLTTSEGWTFARITPANVDDDSGSMRIGSLLKVRSLGLEIHTNPKERRRRSMTPLATSSRVADTP